MRRPIAILFILLVGMTVQAGFKPPEARCWPGGRIYYMYDDSIPEGSYSTFRQAMDDWSQDTGLVFIPRTGEEDSWMLFVRIGGDVSYSGLGWQRGENRILCAAMTRHVAAHEIGHCLSLDHEWARPDRDDYVTSISDWTKVKSPWREGLEYTRSFDILSIMQYGSSYLTINAHPELGDYLGGDLVSPLDKAFIRRVYWGEDVEVSVAAKAGQGLQPMVGYSGGWKPLVLMSGTMRGLELKLDAVPADPWYELDCWEVTGGASVADPLGQKTSLTVTGDFSIVCHSRRISYDVKVLTVCEGMTVTLDAGFVYGSPSCFYKKDRISVKGKTLYTQKDGTPVYEAQVIVPALKAGVYDVMSSKKGKTRYRFDVRVPEIETASVGTTVTATGKYFGFKPVVSVGRHAVKAIVQFDALTGESSLTASNPKNYAGVLTIKSKAGSGSK